MTYTTEQKSAYYSQLRARWQESKKLSVNDKLAEALHREACPNMSYTSFYFTLLDMRTKNLEGLPHVDCKTYKGWHEAGFQVKKGEHATLNGITWIHPTSKDGEENDEYTYPKVYNLFHRSQVEAI